MWDLTIRGVDLYHLISWFILYSFFGWLWETCYVSAKQGKWVNRGFVNGPFCTIYGCGALAVYLILKPFEGNLAVLFLGGILVATILEYVTAVLMENIFHTSWWDYSDKKYNFQGRICLGASIGWGLFSVVLFRVLQPVVVQIVSLYPKRAGEIGICAIFGGYVVDFSFSTAAAFHLRERIPVWEKSLEELQGELLLKGRQKIDALEESMGVSTVNLRERISEKVDYSRRLADFEQKRLAIMEEINRELRRRKISMAGKFGHNIQRYVKAYPNLNRGYKLRRKKEEKGNN